jgi:hypothetical protein
VSLAIITYLSVTVLLTASPSLELACPVQYFTKAGNTVEGSRCVTRKRRKPWKPVFRFRVVPGVDVDSDEGNSTDEWRSFLAPKDEPILAMTDESPKESGHGWMQVDLASSVLSLRCLLAAFPNGLLYRQSVTHKMSIGTRHRLHAAVNAGIKAAETTLSATRTAATQQSTATGKSSRSRR